MINNMLCIQSFSLITILSLGIIYLILFDIQVVPAREYSSRLNGISFRSESDQLLPNSEPDGDLRGPLWRFRRSPHTSTAAPASSSSSSKPSASPSKKATISTTGSPITTSKPNETTKKPATSKKPGKAKKKKNSIITTTKKPVNNATITTTTTKATTTAKSSHEDDGNDQNSGASHQKEPSTTYKPKPKVPDDDFDTFLPILPIKQTEDTDLSADASIQEDLGYSSIRGSGNGNDEDDEDSIDLNSWSDHRELFSPPDGSSEQLVEGSMDEGPLEASAYSEDPMLSEMMEPETIDYLPSPYDYQSSNLETPMEGDEFGERSGLSEPNSQLIEADSSIQQTDEPKKKKKRRRRKKKRIHTSTTVEPEDKPEIMELEPLLPPTMDKTKHIATTMKPSPSSSAPKMIYEKPLQPQSGAIDSSDLMTKNDVPILMANLLNEMTYFLKDQIKVPPGAWQHLITRGLGDIIYGLAISQLFNNTNNLISGTSASTSMAFGFGDGLNSTGKRAQNGMVALPAMFRDKSNHQVKDPLAPGSDSSIGSSRASVISNSVQPAESAQSAQPNEQQTQSEATGSAYSSADDWEANIDDPPRASMAALPAPLRASVLSSRSMESSPDLVERIVSPARAAAPIPNAPVARSSKAAFINKDKVNNFFKVKKNNMSQVRHKKKLLKKSLKNLRKARRREFKDNRKDMNRHESHSLKHTKMKHKLKKYGHKRNKGKKHQQEEGMGDDSELEGKNIDKKAHEGVEDEDMDKVSKEKKKEEERIEKEEMNDLEELEKQLKEEIEQEMKKKQKKEKEKETVKEKKKKGEENLNQKEKKRMEKKDKDKENGNKLTAARKHNYKQDGEGAYDDDGEEEDGQGSDVDEDDNDGEADNSNDDDDEEEEKEDGKNLRRGKSHKSNKSGEASKIHGSKKKAKNKG